MIWFTADHHFSHDNIIKYTDRPFRNSREMDKELITRYNSVVGNNDTVFFLGDFSLRPEHQYQWYRATLKKLKGNKILVLGNHDRLRPSGYVRAGFMSVHTRLHIKIKGIRIVLTHDPAEANMFSDRIVLCGHIHNLFTLQKNAINVGVDRWDYYPVSWEQIENSVGEIELTT